MAYKTIEEAKEKGWKILELEGVELIISQINHLAEIYDKLKKQPGIEVPMAVAVTTFKRAYEIKEDKWVRKEAALSDEKMNEIIDQELNFAKKTYTVKKEIARIGKFTDMFGRAVNMTAEKLLGMVEAFKNKVRPDGVPFKLGHGGEVREGYPAIGWITNLEKIGDKIMATITDIPKTIKEFIENKSYRTVSPEITEKYKDKGYSFVLTALSILGEDAPAISNLNEFSKFFKEAGRELLLFSEPEKEILILNFETDGEGKIVKERTQDVQKDVQKENQMDEKLKLETEKLQSEVIQLREEGEEFKKESVKKLGDSNTEIKKLKDQIEAKEKDVKKKEIITFLETEEIVKRILPKQKEDYTVILMEAEDLEKKKLEIKAYPEIIKFEEQGKSETKTADEKISDKKIKAEEEIRMKEGKKVELDDFELSEKAETKAQEIMKDSKVSHEIAYERALVEISE